MIKFCIRFYGVDYNCANFMSGPQMGLREIFLDCQIHFSILKEIFGNKNHKPNKMNGQV